MLKRVGIAALSFAMALSTSAQEADRDAELIQPPMVEYPDVALWYGMTGYCEVHFTLDPEGHPVNPTPFCSHNVFCWKSKRAISELRMKPAIKNGRPDYRSNIVYPIEFSIEGWNRDIDRKIKPCEEFVSY